MRVIFEKDVVAFLNDFFPGSLDSEIVTNALYSITQSLDVKREIAKAAVRIAVTLPQSNPQFIARYSADLAASIYNKVYE